MPQRTTVCWVLFSLKKQASANTNQSIENKFAKIKNKTKRKEIKLGAWVLYSMPERELTYLCKRSVHLSNANLAQKNGQRTPKHITGIQMASKHVGTRQLITRQPTKIFQRERECLMLLWWCGVGAWGWMQIVIFLEGSLVEPLKISFNNSA